MSSIFTQIVKGEIPCYKIYEDEKTMAFLDIAPEAPGHTLVIPKVEVDKVYDLDDENYTALMKTVKMLATHTHVHLLPINENWAGERELKPTEEEFREMQERLRVN